ncbi:MAG: ABC transporter permease [Lactobacillus sp.]|jgi:ABC-2 type transport system permease protein|nr:ABC transporter permease [Lactobacillus sp.]
MEIIAKPTHLMANTATMAYRNILKTIHNPERLMDVLIQPILFTVMFGYLFGGAIAGGVAAYLPTIVPGILIQTMLSAASGSGSQIREDLDSGVFDRFKSLPMAHIAPLAGQLFADILRLTIATVVAFATGFAMGWRPAGGFGWVLAAGGLAIFTGWAMSWLFALLGLLAKSATMVQSFAMMTMMILSFLSNAFIPLKTLPHWLLTVAQINPITHVITAMRAMLNQGLWTQQAWLVIIFGVAIVLIFAPLTILAYNKPN